MENGKNSQNLAKKKKKKKKMQNLSISRAFTVKILKVRIITEKVLKMRQFVSAIQ